MSANRYTIDTNLLFYAIDSAAGERHLQAERLIALADPFRTVILLQTLGELCFAVSRKRPQLLANAHAVATELANTFAIEAATVADLNLAMEAHQRHDLSFWDAMLWATARRSGCSLVFSEDFQDGRILGGVAFRNPFRISSDELASLLV